jgi:hypothetical protein
MADYRLQLPNADPIMVRANNRAQAIRYATHRLVKIEILTTEEAIRLAKAGQELHDATSEPDEAEVQPQLLEAPEGKGGEEVDEKPKGNDPAAEDATIPGAAKSGASGRSGTSGAGKDKGE